MFLNDRNYTWLYNRSGLCFLVCGGQSGVVTRGNTGQAQGNKVSYSHRSQMQEVRHPQQGHMGQPPGSQKPESRSKGKTKARVCKARQGGGGRLGLTSGILSEGSNLQGWSLDVWPEVTKAQEYCLLVYRDQREEVWL